jgi:Ca-activated chloride channel family protein
VPFRFFELLTLSIIVFQGQETTPFRAEVNLVNITAVVRSRAGALIGDLKQDELEILEDGIPQTIRYFARQTDLPLSLGLIVDTSGSQEHFIKRHDRDVHTFLEEVLRPDDQAFAVCFGNHLRLVSDFSSSAAEMIEAMRRYAKGDYHFPEIGPKEDRDLGTALYDAVYFSAIEKMNRMRGERRAFLVFSDGEENSSEHDLLDAIAAAQNTNTLVYCIRYTHKEHGRLNARNRYGIRVMQHLSSLTGAADFDGTAEDLKNVFAAINEELRSMYEIGYVSKNTAQDGAFRKLTVRCSRPGAIVHAKSGYYAQREKLP